jgi:hypothetical protein
MDRYQQVVMMKLIQYAYMHKCLQPLVKKVKQSRYTPWRGEEVRLLLILDLGTRWG